MSRVAEQYRDKGVVVLAVDVQDGETPEQLKPFVQNLSLKHTILPKGGAVAQKYGVKSTPTTFLINAQGEAVEAWTGVNVARLEQGTKKLAAK